MAEKKAITTVEELKALTSDEVNTRWPEVSAFLEAMGTGWKPRRQAAPESFADVKGMSQAEILQHWGAVVKILEAEASK